MAAAKRKKPTKAQLAKAENSGGSCDYYGVYIRVPTSEEQEPYTAECNDIIEELKMTFAEANMFKEIWRGAAARELGKLKKDNNEVRGAEKISFFSDRHTIQVELRQDEG